MEGEEDTPTSGFFTAAESALSAAEGEADDLRRRNRAKAAATKASKQLNEMLAAATGSDTTRTDTESIEGERGEVGRDVDDDSGDGNNDGDGVDGDGAKDVFSEYGGSRYFTNLGKSVVFLVFGPLLPLLSHGGDSLGSPAFRLLARQMTPTVVAAAFLVATLLGLACFWWYQRRNEHSPQRSHSDAEMEEEEMVGMRPHPASTQAPRSCFRRASTPSPTACSSCSGRAATARRA